MKLQEAEAALELKKMQELGKAELASAIASEKASHIEKMAEANLNVWYLSKLFLAHVEAPIGYSCRLKGFNICDKKI